MVNPRVFTEHGVIMAASVLNSPRAVEVSVFIVRAFVQLREVIAGRTGIETQSWVSFALLRDQPFDKEPSCD